jgi:tetratricopeptide (TPR) repeat protein
LAPLAGAVGLAALALLLYVQGWRVSEAERFRLAAQEAGKGREGRPLQVAALRSAVAWRPNDAALQVDLAEAYYHSYKEQLAGLDRAGRLWDITGVLGVSGGLPGLAPPVEATSAGLVTAAVAQLRVRQLDEELTEAELVPALESHLRARALCPLLSLPNIRLAAAAQHLVQVDARSKYLERATQLRPFDVELRYALGLQLWAEGDKVRAALAWKDCLSHSDQHLGEILDRVAAETEGLLSQKDNPWGYVLPDKPDLWVRAAFRLYPDEASAARRRPFFEQVINLKNQQPGPRSALDLHAEAVARRELGQTGPAVGAYRAALALEPHHADWRFEMAELLVQRGDLEEAQRELITILQEQPGNARADKLWRTVVERQLRGK